MRAQGLPIVIDELLAAARAEDRPGPVGHRPGLPPTLAGLVRRRLTAMEPEDGRCCAQRPCWAPTPNGGCCRRSSGWTMRRCTGRSTRPLAGGLLLADAGRLAWRHALTREAVLAATLPPELAALADRAVAAVDHDDPQFDALRAELLDRAGRSAESGAVLAGLARRDMSRGALRSAADLLDRAAARGMDPGQVAIDRVSLLTMGGRAVAALDVGRGGTGVATGSAHAELCLRMARAAVLLWAVGGGRAAGGAGGSTGRPAIGDPAGRGGFRDGRPGARPAGSPSRPGNRLGMPGRTTTNVRQ